MDRGPKWIVGGGGAAVLGGLSIAATVADRSDTTREFLFTLGLVIAAGGAIAVAMGLLLLIRDSRRRRPDEPVLADESNVELKAYTAGLTRRLREFQSKYNNAVNRQWNRLQATADNLTDEEKKRLFWDRSRAEDVQRNVLMVEFGPLRVRAKATRDEILRRLGRPRPRVGDSSDHQVTGATMLLEHGGFAGPHPAHELADYLDGLALELPNSGPS